MKLFRISMPSLVTLQTLLLSVHAASLTTRTCTHPSLDWSFTEWDLSASDGNDCRYTKGVKSEDFHASDEDNICVNVKDFTVKDVVFTPRDNNNDIEVTPYTEKGCSNGPGGSSDNGALIERFKYERSLTGIDSLLEVNRRGSFIETDTGNDHGELTNWTPLLPKIKSFRIRYWPEWCDGGGITGAILKAKCEVDAGFNEFAFL
jgi:hypothetical protein